MTDTQAALERLKAANAVPSGNSFPVGALSSADLLARIDERTTPMTQTATHRHDPEQTPKRSHGLLIALGAAAAVLVIGVSGFLAGTRSGDEAAATVPTTEAAPTTIATPDYATAQETLNAWAVAIGAGDIDAAMDTHAFEPNDLEDSREAMAYLAATVSHAEFNDCQLSMLNNGEKIVARCNLTLTWTRWR
jgi:hypothetical protein